MDQKLRAYTYAGLVSLIVLLLLLIGVQSIWVAHGSATSLMNEVGLQRTRSQCLVKDVLILAYRPSSQEQAQALNEVQMILPRFQQAQSGLQAGDESLGLPKHPPQAIQLLLIQSQADYLSLLEAIKLILAHPHPVDPTQLQMVLDHERGYTQTISAIATLWTQHIDDAFLSLFYVESGLAGAIFILVCLTHVGVTRRLLILLERRTVPKPLQTLPITQPPEEEPQTQQETIPHGPGETPRTEA